MFLLWHSGQWVGIGVHPDPVRKASHNVRTRTRRTSVHFCTLISATWGGPVLGLPFAPVIGYRQINFQSNLLLRHAFFNWFAGAPGIPPACRATLAFSP